MGRHYLFVDIFEGWNYSFQGKYLKLFFVHVNTCATRNKGYRRLGLGSGEFIDRSSEAKSSEASCIAQRTITDCNCPLLDAADLTRYFAGQDIASAIGLHDLSNDSV